MDTTLTLEIIKKILNERTQDDQFASLKDIPHPNGLKDMEKATQRIVEAIKNNETITIVGDYDVDGVVSTALMVNFFQFCNIPVEYIIPNRFEHGYGLSPKILDKIDGGLIITVDNGISAYEAANICQKKGIDLIITDHHTVGSELPEAFAIVNPKQQDCPFPFKEICGAHVAWYLCGSLKNALGVKYNLMDSLDLLALAIVADIMPMVSLNRTMLKAGLQVIQNSTRPVFIALKQRLGLENINEEDIGFKIAPLINCAGRMNDPSDALELILSEHLELTFDHLEYLIGLNEQRKNQQAMIFEQAKEQVDETKPIILVASDQWNEGIIGIVASKLCEKYKKPSFVLSIDGEKAKASCRSTDTVDLYELIKSCSSTLLGFGGHKQAAGLALKTQNIQKFETQLSQNISQFQSDTDQSHNALGVFELDNVGQEVYNLIEAYRPYGITNPYPLFLFENLLIKKINKIGKNKQYSKLILTNGQTDIDMLVFIDEQSLCEGQNISCVAQISKNEFRNMVEYNLMLKEIISV